MGSLFDAERKAHERTKKQLNAVRTNFETVLRSWEVATVELVELRTARDRATLESARLQAIVRARDEECEALRNQVYVLAKAAGGGAVL